MLILWEFLIQKILEGHPPLITTTLTIILLSALLFFWLQASISKGLTAFIGTICGLFVTLPFTVYFGGRIGLFGLTQPYVNRPYFQRLLRSGYPPDILFRRASRASGAAMDIAMDIAASMHEIKNKKPDIRPGELIKSGFTVGRHVIGTMATTLLLAYSGGFLTLLMIFKVKEPSIMRMLNMKIVAAEIMRTLVGSMGLLMVAPITAVVGGIIIARIYKFPRLNLPFSGRLKTPYNSET